MTPQEIYSYWFVGGLSFYFTFLNLQSRFKQQNFWNLTPH
jgi:hypothetical protein